MIFVHGCFWHRHEGCKRTTTPKTRREFWTDKFASNRKRDTTAVSSLEQEGWEVVIIWECETNDPHRLEHRLVSLLGSTRVPRTIRDSTVAAITCGVPGTPGLSVSASATTDPTTTARYPE